MAVAVVTPTTISLSSLDVPLVALGTATPFPTPRTGPPDMHGGTHFNILQNIWNTNYVMWYPFNDSDDDADVRSRFSMQLQLS